MMIEMKAILEVGLPYYTETPDGGLGPKCYLEEEKKVWLCSAGPVWRVYETEEGTYLFVDASEKNAFDAKKSE